MNKRITEDGEIVDDNCEDCTVYFKTPYNHNRNAESNRVALTTPEPSLTDQSFKEDADINVIIARAQKGELPVVLPEHFGNASEIPTLFEARSRIAESNATFYKLAPQIREEFLNDPARWERQVLKDLDEANLDNLRRMGVSIDDVVVVPRPAPPAAPQGGSPAPGAPAPAGAAPAAPQPATKT